MELDALMYRLEEIERSSKDRIKYQRLFNLNKYRVPVDERTGKVLLTEYLRLLVKEGELLNKLRNELTPEARLILDFYYQP